MGAVELLVYVRAAGLSLAAENGQLIVRPASRLTDPMRAALRDAKSALLELLAKNDPNPVTEDPPIDPLATAALAQLIVEETRQRAIYAEPNSTGYRIGIAVRMPNGGYATSIATVTTDDGFALLGTFLRFHEGDCPLSESSRFSK